MSNDRPTLIPFGAALADGSAKLLRGFAHALGAVFDAEERPADPLATARRLFRRLAESAGLTDDGDLKACAYVLIDLRAQGWEVQATRSGDAGYPVELCRPAHHRARRSKSAGAVDASKHLIRQQLHIARDEQLRRASPRAFVKAMEVIGPRRGRHHRIFELMRDGRELRAEVEAALASPDEDAALARVIQPYVQVIESSDQRCELTDFALQEIWRYFRFTWATPAKSVPGRSMNILVRDRAQPMHPVIGIAALSSAIVNLKQRDAEIGWAPDLVLDDLQRNPTDEAASWLTRLVDTSLRELYKSDLIAQGIVSPSTLRAPTTAVIKRLGEVVVEARRAHTKHNSKGSGHKRLDPRRATDEQWQERAETHLFRSKRARSLATLLGCRRAFKEHMGDKPCREGLKRLLETSEGRRLTRSLILKAKADRVGISIADITVCGSLPPYNHLLGGKLVSMLMASPEVVEGYRRRYADSVSVIASSMAGRSILRAPTLVFLATTSLYGRSSQYNRLKMPPSTFECATPDPVEFKAVGHTEGTGTLQFTRETVNALRERFDEGELRVNNIFGEGVNPRMRLIREGLGALGLDHDALLSHGNRRSIFAVHLTRNTKRFLLGLDAEPDWLIPQSDPADRTQQIVGWWRDRWLARRVKYAPALDQLSQHRCTDPVQHGARVSLPPEDDDQVPLFGDDID